ncbi:MAG: ThuA domain-containing protein [Planctomycetes bacterium]|nr:ThuA domain-containing protein [Planctomycetota bacterium]
MNTITQILLLLLGTFVAANLQPRLVVAETRVVIIVGPSSHPPGTHEVAAGGRLMKHCLETADDLPDVKVDLFNEWPTDQKVLDAASTIVFTGDTFPPNRLPNAKNTLKKLGQMMESGCGIVCVHYATGLRAEDVAADGEHPLLHWMGGYFATRCAHHQSIARIYPAAKITPAAAMHPIWQGCQPFTLHDEPYINNYFGKDGNKQAANVTLLASSLLPPENPKPETVSWCIERADSGRGFGIVMPHFYRSWKIEDLRRFILNGIAWTAKLEVPERGVHSTLPNLATFKPASVEPK